ncbi:alkyl sulfatase C-terminal domain-containing protein [[Kitasatospora] papulosa]|uniref:alkyl sulfatase C-terminal domain-containing protein n=1 Tax=[Kitasatospora] papulosa TaxID=1464011 RepID=UPI0036366AEC
MTPMNRRDFVAATAGAAAAAVSLNPATAHAAPGHRPHGAPTPTRTDGLPYDDTTDFDDAQRGFVAAFKGGPITTADGRTAWDPNAYDFLDKAGDPAPHTVDPSLWRQARLLARQGLYRVTDRVYQVRGLDLSNMTIVEGDTGVIVIDPLISAETAAVALRLYRDHRGERPVRAMIYTHPHVDHFGGCRGVLPDGAGDIPVVAPSGFMEHAVSENVYAGPAMSRRASYMYGAGLPSGVTSQVGCGLGLTVSLGTVGLIPPTHSIGATGEELTLDGVRIRFQMTPGTECQEEMNFLFPDLRAVCMAENATHTMHNIVTLRGAQVRDAHAWAGYLTESIALYTGAADVAFASHHWPDGLAVRVNGPKAWALDLTIDWHVGDDRRRLRLANGLLTRTTGTQPSADVGLTMTMTKAQLLRTLAGRGVEGITMEGDANLLTRLMSVLDKPDKTFAIVTP